MGFLDGLLLLIVTVLKILLIIVPLLLTVAYLTYAERKVIGAIQVRKGPNRVGWAGLLQPIADVLKLLTKEVLVPTNSHRFLFVVAPILSLAPAFAAWAVIPFRGFALVGVLMVGGSLNLGDIVRAQEGSIFHWFWLPLFPLFIVYFISGVAETNRAPFDVAEGESEIVAGFHVDYSGMAFGLFFLAEYANMIMIAALAVIMFLGGWLSPIPFIPDGIGWFFAKTGFMLFFFLWFRATFPRYRYNQIMRLGWKVFIPVTIVWLTVEAVAILLEIEPWFAIRDTI